MDIATRLELIQQVGEEILTHEDLKELLETKTTLRAYDGFEPSGQVHIAQGILRAINVNKMTTAKVHFVMLAADWHAWANNKLGGDLEKINIAGEYLIEVWKACGMDLDKVEFVRSSDVMASPTYWKTVMQIARNTTVPRITRCAQIMGRKENDLMQTSQVLYPCMQCADIFELHADITQLGMDQRKVNILARELGQKIGLYKPVVVSHHMLRGLQQPPAKEVSAEERALELKMSKSKPDSAIFMTDSAEDIQRKIAKAYCPAKVVEENPVLEYCKYILFEKTTAFTIERPEKYGGNSTFSTYQELEKAYREGTVHPQDLKKSTAASLEEYIQPVRRHFEKNKHAQKLLQDVRSSDVTR